MTTDDTPPAPPAPKADDAPKTFTQAELDAEITKIAAKIRDDERKKFADYDDLKKKAEGATTAEDRIAALEKDLTATRTDALRRRVQATHKISDEDAALFLTASDEDGLTAQAKRLAERNAEAAEREVERKKKGNTVPGEGSTPKPGDDEFRELARGLFKPGTT